MFEEQISLKILIDFEEQLTIDIDPNAGQLLIRLRMHQLKKIFEYLPFHDLLSFRATSKKAFANAQIIFEEQICELDNNNKILDKESLLVHSILRQSYFTLEYRVFLNTYIDNFQFFHQCYIEWGGCHRHNRDLFRKLDHQWDFIQGLMYSNYTLKHINKLMRKQGFRKITNFMDIRQGIQSIKDKFINLKNQNMQRKDHCKESHRKKVDDIYQTSINKINKILASLENESYLRYVELVTLILNKLSNQKKSQIFTKLLKGFKKRKRTFNNLD